MRLRLLLLSPLLLVLVLFALSNTTMVALHFWPTDLGLDAPLSVAILIGMALAFIAGSLMTWVGGLGHLRRARRAEARADALQRQIAAMSISTAGPGTPAGTSLLVP